MKNNVTIKVSELTRLDLRTIKNLYGLKSMDEVQRMLIEHFRKQGVLVR